ncbi:MAG TPA: UDP-N-acetylglucosamine diphosphorylase, partial [Phycisphaerales bacterium]|nr:UDP-N-acetylglucosamine diphosphorylase [Phycisphaerales bacterium]
TRMKSDLPKVAHPCAGRAIVEWVVDACAAAGCGRVIVVVGYQQEVVRGILSHRRAGWPPIEFAVQTEQLGTGHAVACARGLLEQEAKTPGHTVFVLAGDGPLIRAETLAALRRRHEQSGASATLATSVIDDPSGYGRIVRDARGRFTGIVEQKGATPEQLAIREVNPSYYCFDARALFSTLARVERNPVSGEYYITDVPSLLMAEGARVEVVGAVPPEDVLSINTPEQLAEVERVLTARLGQPARAGGSAA